MREGGREGGRERCEGRFLFVSFILLSSFSCVLFSSDLRILSTFFFGATQDKEYQLIAG